MSLSTGANTSTHYFILFYFPFFFFVFLLLLSFTFILPIVKPAEKNAEGAFWASKTALDFPPNRRTTQHNN